MTRFVGVCLLLVVAGCGPGVDPKAPKLQPVKGTITLDGKPLANADIIFIPTAGGVESSGHSNAEGQYELSIRNQSGAVAGNHRVAISKRVREDGSEFPQDRSNMGVGKEILPMKYTSQSLTELTAKVDEGENEIDFALKSK